MEFATYEDQTGLYDATFFPSTYRQHCHLLASNQAYLVTGQVKETRCRGHPAVTKLRLCSSPESQREDAQQQ